MAVPTTVQHLELQLTAEIDVSEAGQSLIELSWAVLAGSGFLLWDVGYRIEGFDLSKCQTFDISWLSNVFCPPSPVFFVLALNASLSFHVSNVEIELIRFFGHRHRTEIDIRYPTLVGRGGEGVVYSLSCMEVVM